jgi:hypothetical protein
VSSDPWRQWQALLPLGAFGRGAAPSSGAPGAEVPGFAPFADSAERFAAAFHKFVAAARQRPSSPGDATAATEDAAAAAATAADSFGNFLREHFAGFFKLPGLFGPGMTASPGSAFTDGPALGLGREQLLRAQRAAEAWNRVVQAQARLQRMLADTLREAATAFGSKLPQASIDLPTTETINRMYDRWIDCAEEAYARTAHRDDFCDALSEYVNAGSHWRRESAAGLEELVKLWDLPTRGEINTLTLRIRELEAELLARKRQPEASPSPARSAKSPRSPGPAKRARSAEPLAVGKPKRPAKRRSKRQGHTS